MCNGVIFYPQFHEIFNKKSFQCAQNMPEKVKIYTFAQESTKYAFAYENMQFNKIQTLVTLLLSTIPLPNHKVFKT